MDIAEGMAKLRIPSYEKITSSNAIFYNPLMQVNRDVSILLASLLPEDTNILCGMAGSGIRAIRYVLESEKQVVANDISPVAVKNVEDNSALNEVSIETMNMDFNLISGKYGAIDIDPFGSPVRYINPALRMVKKQGYLFVTATDTAALCGSSFRACVRKYGAYPLKTTYCHEVGLRILMGYLAREAASWNYSIEPLVCFYKDHYMRVHLKLTKGKQRADASIKNLGFLHHCPKCKDRRFLRHPVDLCSCGASYLRAYPLWGGPLFDVEVVKKMIAKTSIIPVSKRTLSLLSTIVEEVDVPYHFDSHQLASLAKVQVPTIDKYLEILSNQNIKCSKTHFSPMAFKADACLKDIITLLQSEIPSQ